MSEFSRAEVRGRLRSLLQPSDACGGLERWLRVVTTMPLHRALLGVR